MNSILQVYNVMVLAIAAVLNPHACLRCIHECIFQMCNALVHMSMLFFINFIVNLLHNISLTKGEHSSTYIADVCIVVLSDI